MLPQVKAEVIDGIMATAMQDDYDSTEIYGQIAQENPVLFEIISLVVKADELSEDFKMGYMRGAAQLYKLLATQAECDELSSMDFK